MCLPCPTLLTLPTPLTIHHHTPDSTGEQISHGVLKLATLATVQLPLPFTGCPTTDNEVHSVLEYKIDRMQYYKLNIAV
jgi:hypothetical protein